MPGGRRIALLRPAHSKPNVVTSDHFLDLEKLTLEPNFRRYLGDAFAPVGLMVDFWAEDWPAGHACQVPVVVMNDLDADWKGTVRLAHPRRKNDAGTNPRARGSGVWNANRAVSNDRARRDRKVSVDCRIERCRPGAGAKPTRFCRSATGRVEGGDRPRKTGRRLIEHHGRRDVGRPEPSGHRRAAVVDGNVWSCWASKPSDAEWIAVDLGRPEKISRVDLIWPVAYGRAEHYAIQVSLDGQLWNDVVRVDGGRGSREILRFSPVDARWVRMLGKKRRSTLTWLQAIRVPGVSMMDNRLVTVGVLAAVMLGPAVGTAQADVFHMPAGQTSLQFVAVGDSGNAPTCARRTTPAKTGAPSPTPIK